MSKLLTTDSDYEPSNTSIDLQVKEVILFTKYGEPIPPPESLKEDKKISSFKFNDFSMMELANRFERIAKKYKQKARITWQETIDCSTVKDCIDLVTKKTSNNKNS